jgi:hypothetical protein
MNKKRLLGGIFIVSIIIVIVIIVIAASYKPPSDERELTLKRNAILEYLKKNREANSSQAFTETNQIH